MNLHAYDMNGNSEFIIPTDDSSAELRGMAQYGSSLFVSQAHNNDVGILSVPLCKKGSAKRIFSGGERKQKKKKKRTRN